MLRNVLLSRLTSLLLVAAAVTSLQLAKVHAHTWVDCIDHSYDAVYTNSDSWVLGGVKGNGACEGYAYQYPGRGSPTIGSDFTWKLLPEQIRADAPVCKHQSSDADYTGWRHVVHAKPGDKLFLAYFSNGHIVKDKAGPGTTWGVYWSGTTGVALTKPSELTTQRLVDGKLNDFDDGNCGQTFVDGDYSGGTIRSGRAGDFKPCVGSFTIPEGTPSGTYSMVWYWTFFKSIDYATNFATFDGAGGAAYSSCFDVVVEAPAADERAAVTTAPTRKRKHRLCGAETPPSPASKPHAPAYPVAAPATPSDLPATVAPPQESAGDASPRPTPALTPAPASADTPAPTAADAPAPAVANTMIASRTSALGGSSFVAPLATVTINGVGGSGSYGKVTNMACPSSDTCTQSDFPVSGRIAPFDEDLTLALRGPMNVDEIAVFTSADSSSTWTRVSSYSKQSATANNIAFLNNKGDPLTSGVFDMCNGNSQSYATEHGKTSASTATTFGGVLDDGVEMNVMSGSSCASSGTCGYSRGVAHQGWQGGYKIFMIKAQMPFAAAGGKNVPAIWLLNGQIVRTAQYGCNCRGIGDAGRWKGGCGELDVAEVLPGDVNSLTSTIYSFKGSRGTSSYALRPVDVPVVFVVILSEQTTTGSVNLGMAQILMMNAGDVDLASPPTQAQVTEWLNFRNGVQVEFDI